MWFQAHHEGGSWRKAPGDFDQAKRQVAHRELLNRVRSEWEGRGLSVFTENQSSFRLRGRTATLGGKPDLIVLCGSRGTIIDVNNAKPIPSYFIPVMTYICAVPRASGQYRGVTFDGSVVYLDNEGQIPCSAVERAGNPNTAVGGLYASRRLPSRVGGQEARLKGFSH